MPIEIVMYMTYDITIPSGTATTQRAESCDGRAEDESDIPSIISPSSVNILNRKEKRPGQRTTADRGKDHQTKQTNRRHLHYSRPAPQMKGETEK